MGDDRRGDPTETLTAVPVPESDADETERRVPETVGRPLVNVENASTLERAPSVTLPDRFDERDCPPFDVDAEQVLCYHGVDPEETALYLAPTRERVEAERALSFVLANRDASAYTINPQEWEIRAASDDWSRIASGSGNLPLVTIRAGQAYTWTVNLRRTTPSDTPYDAIVTLDLEPGLYAFTVSGEYGTSRPDAESEGRQVATLALFEVV